MCSKWTANRKAQRPQWSKEVLPSPPYSAGKCSPGEEKWKVQKWNHESPLIFCVSNECYCTFHLIVPVYCVCSFYSPCSPTSTTSFISLPHSLEALLFPLCLLIFHSLPKPSQFPFVPGTNHPHHYYLVFPALFWAEHLHGMPHSSDAAGKELRSWRWGGGGVVFLECKFGGEERKFYNQLQRHLQFIV